MGGGFTNWFWGNFLGPRNKRRFALRIGLRIRWMWTKRWWRENASLSGLLRVLRRPVALLLIGFGLPLLLLTVVPFTDLIGLGQMGRVVSLNGAVPWRDLIQPLLIIVGLPSAFLLWAFRDANASAAIENQRKDINLKEFQEVQLRAAGALDKDLPEGARQTLQVAAIHQLRPFLRGEYGASFRRPAWELLKARLATSAAETGTLAITQQFERGSFGEEIDERVGQIVEKNQKKLDSFDPSPVSLAERMLIAEEAQRIFRRDLPLQGGRYDGVSLHGALLSRLDLSRASFVGARLFGAHLEGADITFAQFNSADLRHAHLERADLSFTRLEGGNLRDAHLESADLRWAHLEGADLKGAHLEGADLYWAHLEGADLKVAHLEGADLKGAHLEGADFFMAHLEGADLSFTHLKGAQLSEAHLEGASLSDAHLEGAKLIDARLEGADLSEAGLDDSTKLKRAIFDDSTKFAYDWETLSEAERDAARAPWVARGMRHVRDAG